MLYFRNTCEEIHSIFLAYKPNKKKREPLNFHQHLMQAIIDLFFLSEFYAFNVYFKINRF